MPSSPRAFAQAALLPSQLLLSFPGDQQGPCLILTGPWVFPFIARSEIAPPRPVSLPFFPYNLACYRVNFICLCAWHTVGSSKKHVWNYKDLEPRTWKVLDRHATYRWAIPEPL
jgi:hypothetical protein